MEDGKIKEFDSPQNLINNKGSAFNGLLRSLEKNNIFEED
jgi:hypothetical protein